MVFLERMMRMIMETIVRQAKEEDFPRVLELLYDISSIHHEGRPDIFKKGSAKYDQKDFIEILDDKDKPVFVAVDQVTGQVSGYAFCQCINNKENNVLHPYRSLYIDDLCVDRSMRNSGVGKKIFQAVKEYARMNDYHHIDLNVWELNKSAIRFYESCGMETQKRKMELKLE